MPPLKDYVVARRQEIFDEIAVLKARLVDLERERNQLEALSRGAGVRSALAFSDHAPAPEVEIGGKLTIKQAVLITLGRFPEGLRIQELIERVREVTGLTIAEASLWPQMNRLKNNDGKINNLKGVWRLTDHGDAG
jgi:hypothetical protein